MTAFFLVPVSDGVPAFADTPGASWRIAPAGDEAILEIDDAEPGCARVRAGPDSSEITREEAQRLARGWDTATWGGAP